MGGLGVVHEEGDDKVIYGYARVSTPGQAKNQQGLQIQEEKLKEAGCEVIYKDVCTGATLDRPGLNEMLSKLERGDKVMVTTIDRLSRCYEEGRNLLAQLRGAGIEFQAIDVGMLKDTAAGRFAMNMMLMYAEMERDMVHARTFDAFADARNRNPDMQVGRKRIEIDDLTFSEYVDKNRSGEMTIDECCHELGISRSTWYNRTRTA